MTSKKGKGRSRCDVVIDYFYWLCEIINSPSTRDKYWELLKILHKKEFYWIVPNDDNRGVDGLKLRENFARQKGFYPLNTSCSVLEMLIALAIRWEDMMADPYIHNRTSDWFWEMIDNLGLLKYTDDRIDDEDLPRIDEILDDLLNRNYARDGKGGLFPLMDAEKDQQNVEIWYQMAAYLHENYDE